jgi:serine/threonine protein kinase
LLGPKRFTQVTPSAFAHERHGLQLVRESLPDRDPYHLWTSALLFQGPRAYEIDGIAIGTHCIYLLELKAYSGRIEGDLYDWYLARGSARHYREGPWELADRKAKVLKTLLRKHLHDVPYIQPLIFLHGQDVKLALTGQGNRSVVVGPQELQAALIRGKYPGCPGRSPRLIDPRAAQQIRAAMGHIGLKQSERNRRIGPYQLEKLIEEGGDYQDYLASQTLAAGGKREYRLRIFVETPSLSAARRRRQRQLAEREEVLLAEVGRHPNILTGYPGLDSDRGWAVPLEHFPNALPLDVWIKEHPSESLEQRARLFGQLCSAVSYCHDRKIVHRRIEPKNVLVAPGPGGPELRLKNFQRAKQGKGSDFSQRGTTTRGEETALIYRAPEVLADASSANILSDVYSLGAVAYLLFAGKPPAQDMQELWDRLQFEDCLRLDADADGVPTGICQAVAFATSANRKDRSWASAHEFHLAVLEELDFARQEDSDEPTETADPLLLKAGDELGEFLIEKPIGEGATSVAYLVRYQGARRVLKVSRDDEAAEFLQEERRTLSQLDDERVVKVLDAPVLLDHYALVLDKAADLTLSRYLRENGSCGLEFTERWGRTLLEALIHLEERSILHRDLKPANLGLGLAGQKKERELFVFDFSHSHLDPKNVSAGTDPYRDPWVMTRGRWDRPADRYSAAVILYEMITGTRPPIPRPTAGEVSFASDALYDACRAPLTKFFRRAFVGKATERFQSADQMLAAWRQAFREAKAPSPEVAAISWESSKPGTSVLALPISGAAKNGLERNGVRTAGDLAKLRLKVLRGVGHAVLGEIHGAAETLREHFEFSPIGPEVPFFVGYPIDETNLLDVACDPTAGLGIEQGAQLELNTLVKLDEDLALDLAEQGYETLTDVANSPDVAFPESEGQHLREVLTARAELLGGREPGTLDGWIERIEVGFKRVRLKKHRAVLRQLFGLDPTEGFGPCEAPSQLRLAELLDLAQPHLSRWSSKLRQHLFEDRQLVLLARELEALVDSLGGARPLADVARAYLDASRAVEGVEFAEPPDEDLRQSAVLVRVASEVALLDEDRRLQRRQVRDEGEILETVPHLWRALRELGREADRLADSKPLRSVQACRAQLGDALVKLEIHELVRHGTPLDSELLSQPDSFWVDVGVSLSDHAALSRRGEVYPSGLEPGRLIDLLVPSLPSELSPSELQRLARTRYPAAKGLPDRPELDRLLEGTSLAWAEDREKYCRAGMGLATAHFTGSRTTTPREQRGVRAGHIDEKALDRRLLRERLETDGRRQELRVLMVRASHADRLVPVLEQILRRGTGEEPAVVSVDQALIAGLEERAAELAPDAWDRLLGADAAGPAGGADWQALRQFAEQAATTWLEKLVAGQGKRPLILRDLGAVVHLRLECFVANLIEAAGARGDLGAVFMVCPQSRRYPDPLLLDVLPVPTTPGQALRVPGKWVEELTKVNA